MNKSVVQKVRQIVIPSNKLQKDKSKIAKQAFNLVRKQASKYPQVVDVEFGGSYAKGTWLPDKADLDIFVKFKTSTSAKNFEDISKKVGFDSMNKFHPYVRYSEHPYVEAKIKKTKINVVPCYDVQKGKWQSSADRSSFHTKFMLESLTGQMKDDVRMLKSFLKNNGIYGAEIAKQGFSGYVTEVLLWHYGSFQDVIKAIAKLKPNQVIGKPSNKFETPLVIIDPIDDKRNLAAAISTESIAKFVLLSRAFLKNPSINYFKSRTKKLGLAKKKYLENTVVVKFSCRPRSPDIIWGQIKRAANSLTQQLELGGFKVIRSAATTDEEKEVGLIFLFQSLSIDQTRIKEGPNFFSESDSEKFIKKNSKKSKLMWVGNSQKILSLEKRKYDDAIKFLKNLLKENINNSGIPKGLKDDLKKGFKVFSGDKTSSKAIKKAFLELVLTDETIFSSN